MLEFQGHDRQAFVEKFKSFSKAEMTKMVEEYKVKAPPHGNHNKEAYAGLCFDALTGSDQVPESSGPAVGAAETSAPVGPRFAVRSRQPSRRRAGLLFTNDMVFFNEGDLTEAQLEAIKADDQLVIRDLKAGK